jgi:hypothetical protein
MCQILKKSSKNVKCKELKMSQIKTKHQLNSKAAQQNRSNKKKESNRQKSNKYNELSI